MNRLLLVEDDPNLAKSLTGYLQREGYEVAAVASLTEARGHLKTALPVHAIILDWGLPDGHGVDFVRELRHGDNRIPVIFLTARTELIDKILGLEAGANDYLTKPFEPRELVARLRVQWRNQQGGAKASAHIRIAGIEMNLTAREVRFRGQAVELTKMEYELLKVFVESPNKVFGRDELLDKVWGYQSYPTTRTIDSHMLQLRQKLADGLFETIRGVGYRFKAPQPSMEV